MTVLSGLDAAGRRRSPATLPGYHAGRPPRNKGLRYPADPPTIDELVAVMRHTSDDRHGWRVRAMIVVLWRVGLRVQEALALAEHDLDHRRGSILVRQGKGGRRREVGMDEWGWEQLRPWLNARLELPVGPLFCIIDGPTRGRPWSGAAVRSEFRRLAVQAGVRRPLRAAPAASRARARTRPRRRAAEHHPAPAQPRQPRHDLDLPARHRPRGDHRHRPHAPRTNDVRERRPAAVIELATHPAGAPRRSRCRMAKQASRRDRSRRVVLVPRERLAGTAGRTRIGETAGALTRVGLRLARASVRDRRGGVYQATGHCRGGLIREPIAWHWHPC
jgi:Phage integrase family